MYVDTSSHRLIKSMRKNLMKVLQFHDKITLLRDFLKKEHFQVGDKIPTSYHAKRPVIQLQSIAHIKSPNVSEC